ncbi:MAG TPA: M28 family peptidase [Pseudonocardiaceae bacterium]
MSSRLSRFWPVAVSAAAVGAFLVVSQPSSADPDTADHGGSSLARQLVRDVTLDGVLRHEEAFQRIASTYGNTRSDSSPGYIASVEYVGTRLRDAGFDVTVAPFQYRGFVADAVSLAVDGTPRTIVAITFSPSTGPGGVTAPLVAVPQDATPGCEATDYAGLDATGKIALIRRGSCTFADKARIARDAGAVAVVIANNVAGPPSGTLQLPENGTIPIGIINQADGDALFASGGTAALVLSTRVENRTSHNILAQTRTGRTDNVVMAGAHLDSVPAGAGINDNGSGSSALLETALELGPRPRVTNAVRFAWWGAEELSLVGSRAWVAALTPEQKLDIALYLNFDMIGSPNAAYFVYDGDNSDGVGAGPGPEGSAAIEAELVGFHARNGVQTEGTDFTGRSDYGPFIENGIPSGGLFTGAEGIKTQAQAGKWGGQAGVAYDRCYHQACDTMTNLDRRALERNADAMAHVVATYAMSTRDVNGERGRAEQATSRAAAVTAMEAARPAREAALAAETSGHDHIGCGHLLPA